MGGKCQKGDTYKVCDTRPYLRNKPVIWIMGPQGSGKSTQCARIVHKFDYDCIQAGPLLRHEVQNIKKKKEKLEMQTQLDSGELMPNEMTLEVLRRALKEVSYSCVGVIIDDFPREMEQAQLFQKSIVDVDAIIILNCPDDVLLKRFKKRAAKYNCPIDEDIIEAYTTQIGLYNDMLADVLPLFPACKIFKCNGNQKPDQVFKEIIKAITKTSWTKRCARSEAAIKVRPKVVTTKKPCEIATFQPKQTR